MFVIRSEIRRQSWQKIWVLLKHLNGPQLVFTVLCRFINCLKFMWILHFICATIFPSFFVSLYCDLQKASLVCKIKNKSSVHVKRSSLIRIEEIWRLFFLKNAVMLQTFIIISWVPAHKHAHIHTRTHTNINIHTVTHTRSHTHTHKHTHSHTHTHN